jgi:hypothetical protein
MNNVSHIKELNMSNRTSMFSQFRSVIETFSPHHDLDSSVLTQLRLHREGPISVTYAPFDHIARSAKLVVVGITPGRVQAVNALRAAHAALCAGQTEDVTLRIAKQAASFSGTQTRKNLVAMLDAIGIAEQLKLETSAELFDPVREQIHFTSALRYPVFVDGQNYNGSPHMIRTAALRKMIETYLAEEVAALPNALWLPLGSKPSFALRHLVACGALSAAQLLDGMPHPSGLNGERVAAFLGRIGPDQASVKTKPEKLLAARSALQSRVTQFFA